ncbi:MAG TPA: hypothetical protein VIY86_06975, partial [Pirellulaceae bacterium]
YERMESLVRVGLYEEAAQQASQELPRAIASKEVESLMALIRVFTLCATSMAKEDATAGREGEDPRPTYLEQALAALQALDEAGGLRDEKTVEQLLQDPDLAPLRSRVEFQTLIPGNHAEKDPE